MLLVVAVQAGLSNESESEPESLSEPEAVVLPLAVAALVLSYGCPLAGRGESLLPAAAASPTSIWEAQGNHGGVFLCQPLARRRKDGTLTVCNSSKLLKSQHLCQR